MVVKMMKWKPSKKLEAKITVHELRGLSSSSTRLKDSSRFSVEIKWKGSKGIGLSSLRRKVRRNFTKEEFLREDGIVRWDEEFKCFCSFSPYKDGLFHPWEVSFAVFNGSKQGTSNNVPIIAKTSLNLSDFASAAEKQNSEIKLPLSINGNAISLHLFVTLLELRNGEELSDPMPRPVLSFPRSPCYGEVYTKENEDISSRKLSPLRVNIFKSLSALRAKRPGREEEEGSDGRSSEEIEFNSPLDADALYDTDDPEEVKEDSRVGKSFDYGTLVFANHVGASGYSNTSSSDDEDWIYYSHQKSNGSDMNRGDKRAPVEVHDRSSKHSLLPWRKRKLSFRSPKVKGEPLLKKCYGEEGGDDIDFDRRQLGESNLRKTEENSVANESSASAFGDDNFAVGTWESKEIISRDGKMKLKTQVFFASIDQRSERAAGESACTALVAVIADFLQSNDNGMPIKSQLDSLIREGSLEWRNLCENESYRERFPDKHFDLETVLNAKVRPLCVVPEKSFVGFFHPEGLEDNKGFEFLRGVMSFENIWDEISLSVSEMQPDPVVYIISWNDHFFILKVERDAYYIIDTLGERLYEGCNQAYILKFDRNTIINRIGNETQKLDDKPEKEVVDEKNEEDEPIIVCTGKESCKEYIKRFLAAIPIRGLKDDLKKGLMASMPLHQRLQIEFHYTRSMESHSESSVAEAIDDAQANLQLEPEKL